MNNDKCKIEKKNDAYNANHQFISNIVERKIDGKRIPGENRVNPFLKISFNGWVLPYTNNLRKQVTKINGNNDRTFRY